MDKKDYALTKVNLVYMGLFEPFYDLYISYKDILTEGINTLSASGVKVIWSDRLIKATNNKSRKLFNKFFEKYSYVFTDDSCCLHTNTIFMNRICIYYLADVSNPPFLLEMRFSSFTQFLSILEWSVAYLIRNRLYKAQSLSYDEDTIIKRINSHIQEQVNKEKDNQIQDLTDQIKPCKELVVYENLKLISCNQKMHSISSEFCFCLIKSEKAVRLPVHVCSECNKVFIGKQTLRIYEQIYGLLEVSKYQENGNSVVDFDSFGMSELYLTGYNARENGMTDQERQRHLKHLIDSGTLSYFAIIRDLEDAIHWHKNKVADRFAVEKWKKDLAYVNSLIEIASDNEGS